MPKTYRNLYPRICDFENLYQAHRRARRGGKRKRPEVAEFEHNLGENLLRLQAELEAQSYQPGPYRHFLVIERKERKISAAPYRDRVVHHALMQVVQPVFEARMRKKPGFSIAMRQTTPRSEHGKVDDRRRVGKKPGFSCPSMNNTAALTTRHGHRLAELRKDLT